MLKLGKALGDFAPGTGKDPAGVDPVALLGAGWIEIVGEENAHNSHPAQVTGDCLIITTRSSVWSQQLSYLADPIVAAVQKRLPDCGIAKVRFRVGRLHEARTVSSGRRAGTANPAATGGTPAANAQEALEHFKGAVADAQRAKRALGWKECSGCTALIAPDAGPFCTPCANARQLERERLVSRVLYEAPWLGFAGTERLIEGLTADEYSAIRHRLLAGWWDRLCRAQRNGKLSRDGSERMIASSYVMLKSERAPERIDPATVRNVLGQELHDFIYGTEQQK